MARARNRTPPEVYARSYACVVVPDTALRGRQLWERMARPADARVRPEQEQPNARDHLTVERAIDRLAEAAQRVVADQIEGARLDLKVAGGRMLRSAALFMVGTLVLCGSWTALTLAAYVHFAPQLSPEQRLGLIALAHGLLGLGLLLAGARVMKAHGND
jgi:hypothetical protein